MQYADRVSEMEILQNREAETAKAKRRELMADTGPGMKAEYILEMHQEEIPEDSERKTADRRLPPDLKFSADPKQAEQEVAVSDLNPEKKIRRQECKRRRQDLSRMRLEEVMEDTVAVLQEVSFHIYF